MTIIRTSYLNPQWLTSPMPTLGLIGSPNCYLSQITDMLESSFRPLRVKIGRATSESISEVKPGVVSSMWTFHPAVMLVMDPSRSSQIQDDFLNFLTSWAGSSYCLFQRVFRWLGFVIICFGLRVVMQAILVTTPSCLQKMVEDGSCSLALVSFIVSF